MHFLLLKSPQIGVQERMWVMFSFGSDYSVIIGEGHSVSLEIEASRSPESSLDILWVCQGELTSVIGME